MKSFFKNLWAAISGQVRLMANTTYNAPNQGRSNNGIKTFKADEAITRYHLVERGVGTPTDEYVQTSDSATDQAPLGISLDALTTAEAAAGGTISVAVLGACKGTQLVVATGAIAVGAKLQSQGDGTVKTLATGFVIGRALQASQATGDVIEMTPFLDPVST
jgi:hypothetical protein